MFLQINILGKKAVVLLDDVTAPIEQIFTMDIDPAEKQKITQFIGNFINSSMSNLLCGLRAGITCPDIMNPIRTAKAINLSSSSPLLKYFGYTEYDIMEHKRNLRIDDATMEKAKKYYNGFILFSIK